MIIIFLIVVFILTKIIFCYYFTIHFIFLNIFVDILYYSFPNQFFITVFVKSIKLQF